MNGEERRQSILQKLIMSKEAIPGVALSKEFDVSRQVIVQDIALLRANGNDIFSTNKGYLIQPQEAVHSRVFKLINTSAEEEEKRAAKRTTAPKPGVKPENPKKRKK